MIVKTIYKQLSVGFSKEVLSKIKEFSDNECISLAEWVRRAVYKELHSPNSPDSKTIAKKDNEGGFNNGNF